MATIGLTGTTGIGTTKQIAKVRLRYADLRTFSLTLLVRHISRRTHAVSAVRSRERSRAPSDLRCFG